MSLRKNMPAARVAQPSQPQQLIQRQSARLSTVQRQGAGAQAKQPPAAPPVYRPQPTPKVLQTKKASRQQSSALNSGNGGAPATKPTHHLRQANPATHKMTGAGSTIIGRQPNATTASSSPSTRRLPPLSPAAQAKANIAQAKTVNRLRPQKSNPAQSRGGKQGVLQPFTSSVVQAIKVYPNLHPGAVEPVNKSEVFKLHSFVDQYRLRKADSHGVYVPNQQYNFVRTKEGEMLLHNRYRHPSIAEGQQVLYAGEVFFNNGKLKWWSNGSGHYQPDVEDATQASLPMDYFYSYQQIIKGEHMRKETERG